MIQARKRHTAAGAVPSTGNIEDVSPESDTGVRARRPTTGRIGAFYHDGFNSDALYVMAMTPGNRLDHIGDRAIDLDRLIDQLMCSESLNRHTMSLLNIARRELDMIATIALQPMITVEPIQ